MRWVMRSLVALVVAWALFLMSPYVAFYRLAKAVEAKDVAVLTERVNFRAVRISFRARSRPLTPRSPVS